MKNNQPYFSVVVPAYNEEGSVAKLHSEILTICRKINRPFEIIFINDGSNDKTLEILKTLSPIKIISFRKNFGQTAAMDAGFKAANGKLIITMDGDGQNDPADIPKLLLKLDEGYDVVSGWRRDRRDPFLKRFISGGANFLRRYLINDGIHDSGCSLKIYKRECFETVDLYGEMHRFIPAVLKLKGFKIGEIAVNHRPRTRDQSKYSWKRTIKGFLDMISVWFWKKFANRPLHLFGSFGLFLLFISFAAGATAIYKRIFSGLDLSDTALTDLAMFGFLAGIQFVVFGLIADTLSKNYYATSNDKSYIIKEIIEK